MTTADAWQDAMKAAGLSKGVIDWVSERVAAATETAEDGGVAAVSAGERHIVVSYQPGSVNLRVLPPDATMGQADADALSAAAGLLATQRDGLATRIEAALNVEVSGHGPRLEKGRTTESGWLATVCICDDYAWPCPHVLAAQMTAVKAALAAGQEADG